MKDKSFLWLIIISLFVINIFTLVRFYNKNKQRSIEANSNNQEIIDNNDLVTFRLNFETNFRNSNLQIDNNFILDSLNNMYPLQKIFTERQERVLVFRLSEMHCESCVNSSIQILLNWVDSIGNKNVVLLGNHRNNRILYRTLPLYGIQNLKVYNCPNVDIPVERLVYPFFFMLDSNLHIYNVFVPDKATPNITNKYLEIISKKF